MRWKLTPRRIILYVFILLVILIARPAGFLFYNYFKDGNPARTEINGRTNDASHLNETRVDTIIQLAPGKEAAIQQVIQLIRKASSEGKKISIAGAQHSMGGHTIYPGGILLDMKGFHTMELDTVQNILNVGAGARWSDVIPFLDSFGKSVSVMQSNNSFSVGGSVSVNCHGWQPDAPPIASTVESFRLIDSKGNIINCSRKENAPLFALVLGGYGLFGVILDVSLKVTDNRMYRLHQYVISSTDYVRRFDELIRGQQEVGLVYGRININPNHFMEEAILSVFRIDENEKPRPLRSAKMQGLRRTVFRSSAGSKYGKNLRWRAEKLGAKIINGQKFSRNQLLNESVEVYQNTRKGYTDILQEYFIPRDSVNRFIEAVKKIIPEYKTDLLNITLRNVKKDDDTFMHYANEEVFGFVMLFNQATDTASENEMRGVTRELIDKAIALRGTYYLPYRLHATKDQLNQAYPQAKDFFILKIKYDPEELFNNGFYQQYH